MFIVHNAAFHKDLLNDLISVIENQPLQDIFRKEWFLIENQAMECWLSQQLAQHFKVWAHYQFLLPSQFFKQLSQKIDPLLSKQSFDKDSLVWLIEQQLQYLDNPIYAPLKQYLQGNNIPLKRYQLAKKIAQLFDKYSHFRAELLNEWQNDDSQCQQSTENWQRALWQQVNLATIGHFQSSLWQVLINTLNNATVGTFKYLLPGRLFIFGISHLPPLYLDYLQALAQHCELHFYLLRPVSTSDNLHSNPQHSLWVSLGQQQQQFQQLLVESGQFKLEKSVVKIPLVKNNLQQLQYDIIQPLTEKIPLKNDGSISIHACHSRMREIEVLKNVLLHCLETNLDLNLRDIVIVAPDIQHYAPFIRRVFDEIPHNMNRDDVQENKTGLNVFIAFLEGLTSRFEWQFVFELLEHPYIFPKFDLSPTDLISIKHWLMTTHVRWGKSAEHKQQLGLPPLDENTWQASLERLLMGYAVATDENFVDQILPCPELEGSSAQALGGLYDFMQLLFTASQQLTSARCFQDWGKNLYDYAKLLFIDNSETQALYNVLSSMKEKPNQCDHVIDLVVITHWLEDSLTQAVSTQEVLRGHLNFSSINAVRGIPFKVIAILGMNEGEFPSIDSVSSFDLLTAAPKAGDPSERINDRQQFLELLLAAEQQLIVSYIGQSQNQTLLPSVIISECLEVMERDYQLNDLVITHPLQPFSRRYFEGSNPQLFSYSTTDAETANALAQEKPFLENGWQVSIKIDTNKVIELQEIRRFYRHPQRYFIHRQLGVYFQSLENVIEAREPFAIDTLEAYAIHNDWIECLLQQRDFSLAKLQAQGRWLSGILGEAEFSKQQPAIVDFVTQIQALELGEALENLAIDMRIGETRLIGKLYNRYQQGSLFYRYAKLKGKDLMLALLHHCLINQHQPQSTYIVSQDYALILTPEHQSFELLEALLMLYIKGLAKPNALFVDIALDYVKRAYQLEISSRSQKSALEVATDQLKLCLETDYEFELQWLYKNSDDLTQVFPNDFIVFCEQLLKPLWAKLMET